MDSKKIYVIPANDGKPPIFGGGAGDISHLVRREMLAKLQSTSGDEYDQPVSSALAKLAKESLTSSGGDFLIKDISTTKQTIMTFAGSQINRTILLFLKVNKNDDHALSDFVLDDFESSISSPNLHGYIKRLTSTPPIDSKQVRQWLLDNQESIKEFVVSVKYLDLLPTNLQMDYLIENYFNIDETNAFIFKHAT
jgi:ATP-dependent Lhr-like helicase